MITRRIQTTRISKAQNQSACLKTCLPRVRNLPFRPSQPLAQAGEVHVAVDPEEDLGASTDSRSPLVGSKQSAKGADAPAKPEKEKGSAPLTASGVKREKEKAKTALKPKGQGPPPQLHELPDEVLISLFAW